jgi:hypothetical protein
VAFSVQGVQRRTERISAAELRAKLMDLPIKAWPYGRVVAVQHCCLGFPSGDRSVEFVASGSWAILLGALAIATKRVLRQGDAHFIRNSTTQR